MKIKSKKGPLLAALSLLLGLCLPFVAPGLTNGLNAAELRYKLVLKNQKDGVVGHFVLGAIYTLTQIEGEYDPGQSGGAAPPSAFLKDGVDVEIKDQSTINAQLPLTVMNYSYQRVSAAGETGGYLELELPPGRYTIKEKSPAPGYYPWQALPSGEEVAFDLPFPKEDGTGWQDELELMPKATEIEILGHVELSKIDPDTNQALTEVQFRLEKADENGVFKPYAVGEGPAAVSEFTTDSEGKIKLQNLPGGQYRLVEIKAPAGYVRNPEALEFAIDQAHNNSWQKLEINNYKEILLEKRVQDEAGHEEAANAYKARRDTAFRYQLELTLSGNVQNYRRLVLTDAFDQRLRLSPASVSIKDAVNDKDLSAIFDLSLNNNQLTLKGKTGFSEDGQTGSADAAWAAALAGVKKLLVEVTVQLETDDAQTATIENYFKLDYIAALDHLKIDPESQNPTPVGASLQSNVVSVKAENAVLKIKKLDGEDKQGHTKLAGVVFDLYKEPSSKTDRQPIRSGITTDVNGEALIEHLDTGTYYLKEMKTAEGYRLPQKDFTVGPLKDDATLEMTINNYKATPLPVTGTQAMLGFALVGLLLLAGGLFWRRRAAKAEAFDLQK